ncbi:MAG: hypothetical protein H7Y31_03780, partial [Chitinophagaceae bacterium]|nr:hypothetical protein [Chitinophagaceae bacterium]
KAGFIGLILHTSFPALSQPPIPVKQFAADKPFIFTRFSSKTSCSLTDLAAIFQKVVDDSIAITIAGTYTLHGLIVEKLDRGEATSINVRLTDFPRAIFNLSMQHDPSGLETITGRVVDPGSGDVLILSRINNSYFFIKELQKHFMTE